MPRRLTSRKRAFPVAGQPVVRTAARLHQPRTTSALPLMDLVAEDHSDQGQGAAEDAQRGKSDGKPLECCLMHKEGRRVAISAQMMPSTVDGEQLIEMLIRAGKRPPLIPLRPAVAAVAPWWSAPQDASNSFGRAHRADRQRRSEGRAALRPCCSDRSRAVGRNPHGPA